MKINRFTLLALFSLAVQLGISTGDDAQCEADHCMSSIPDPKKACKDKDKLETCIKDVQNKCKDDSKKQILTTLMQQLKSKCEGKSGCLSKGHACMSEYVKDQRNKVTESSKLCKTITPSLACMKNLLPKCPNPADQINFKDVIQNLKEQGEKHNCKDAGYTTKDKDAGHTTTGPRGKAATLQPTLAILLLTAITVLVTTFKSS